jgi:hypothetical protein|nr:MAG TPA: Major capsid protein [Bacteriophage sp.]DAP37035.1 MAG TPA: Major capsid protein [Ackermannviridae sp.]DAR64425.1 MAG TPA: Major capsid protein [Caudoviricetes sp.]DAW74763.1 MAG TPA: Major capsid protein [Ackermannviridae sp.]
MRELLTSGAVGSIELNAQKKIREDIQNRWSNLHLLDGLDGHIKETVSTLYENQAKHLIYEATTADNSGSFETVVFPLIRRVFSKLLANDIVSVQAMNLPIGKLFFIKPVTSEREWDFKNINDGIQDGDTGKHVGLMGYQRKNRFFDKDATFNANDKTRRSFESYARYALPDEVVQPVQNDANTTLPEVTRYMKKSLYDLFYNDFLFDNSKGKITIKVGSASVVEIAPNGDYVEVTNVANLPLNSQTKSLDKLLLQIGGFASYNAGRLTGPDGNEMDTEAFLASLKVINKKAIDGGDDFTSFEAGEAIPFRVVTQKYGAQLVDYHEDICDGQGKMYIELDLTKPMKKAGASINGYVGVKPDAIAAIDPNGLKDLFNIAWAQYDSLELETEMGEVSFQLTSETVSVEERKLRATWSPELAQDVSAFHNIDAEAELTAILSEQIAAEVDREILRDLRKAAPWKQRWDYNGWQRLAVQSSVYTQKDWNQTLITKINQISAQIQKSTLRGGANWIVVSSEISAVFNDLEYFHVTDASAESDQYNMGIEKIGSLQGRYNVIVDPYSPHWSLIMGHHGTSLLDTGYIYAPYVPMALTPTMYNPFNFAPVKGICTRYAKKLVNNKYFGAVQVDGLVYFNPNELR